MIAKTPFQGGLTWVVLQYLLGLQQLGHEVHFLELISETDLEPEGAPLQKSINATYFQGVIDRFGLSDSVTLLNIDTMESIGKTHADLLRYTHQCDLLLNLSGLLTEQQFINPIPLRAYVDLDPAFTQLWESEQGIDVGMAGHNRFVTIGMGLGLPNCNIPTLGKNWVKTLQPLVLSNWPIARGQPTLGLTTVANWRGYGSVEYKGLFHGQKAHSLRPFFELPRKTHETFNLALSIHREEVADLEQLNRFGWKILDPSVVAGTTEAFQRFVQQSKAEFGFAKSGYVISRCGWFSDRSIGYLASGRPVIAQETGFSEFLPTGHGLFAYETEAGLLNCIAELNTGYEKHCAAARDIAEEFFDSGKVLTRILRRIGAV